MTSWGCLCIVIALSILPIVTSIYSVSLFHAMPTFLNIIAPYLHYPYLRGIGGFVGFSALNMGLTHSNVGFLGMPNFYGRLLGSGVSPMLRGIPMYGTPTGGVVVGLNGMEIGGVIIGLDGRQIAVNHNHLYLGYVTSDLGRLIVIGQTGVVIGTVINGGGNQGSRPNQQTSSFRMVGPTGFTNPIQNGCRSDRCNQINTFPTGTAQGVIPPGTGMGILPTRGDGAFG